jgi:hypothetical protein
MSKTLVAAAAALLTTAGACLAQPPGITREMIERALPVEAATFDLISHLPTFYGARHNAGHTATVFHPGGGEFANVASNWLLWTFEGDKKAGAMFVGKNCGLCTNSNWDVRSKGIKQ